MCLVVLSLCGWVGLHWKEERFLVDVMGWCRRECHSLLNFFALYAMYGYLRSLEHSLQPYDALW